MRTLLLPMTEVEKEDAVLTAAFDLAQRFSAHLTGLFLRPDPRAAIPFMGEGLTADAIQDLVDASEREGKARASKCQAVFEARRKAESVPSGDGTGGPDGPTVSWEEAVGFIADKIGRAARLADLTIVPQPDDGGHGDAAELLNEVLFRSGRPLMMTPSDPPSGIGRHVLLAWNGRAECARTAASALPILRKAESLKLLQIDEEHPDRPDLEALALYFARHGIATESIRRESGDESVGESILETAREEGVDLLVMGAFSHSRWREMIIGGVTRHAIQHAPIPVFMSH